MELEDESKKLLPHHEQQELCTTRLPYRQGRKLTAVKVYTINNESKHLLVFGVPSLNLRQEAKSLFMKFGRLQQFTISKDHYSEKFTETYHAVYERIQSARVAKKMLDTKNFYGGSLHICYAPELESVDETKNKLIQRKKDVQYRLTVLSKEIVDKKEKHEPTFDFPIEIGTEKTNKLNMGEINTINIGPDSKSIGKQIRDVKKDLKRKVKSSNVVIEKQFKPNISNDKNIEIVDLTSVEKEIVTNIQDPTTSSYDSIVVKKIAQKPLNVIKFNLNKNET